MISYGNLAVSDHAREDRGDPVAASAQRAKYVGFSTLYPPHTKRQPFDCMRVCGVHMPNNPTE